MWSLSGGILIYHYDVVVQRDILMSDNCTTASRSKSIGPCNAALIQLTNKEHLKIIERKGTERAGGRGEFWLRHVKKTNLTFSQISRWIPTRMTKKTIIHLNNNNNNTLLRRTKQKYI